MVITRFAHLLVATVLALGVVLPARSADSGEILVTVNGRAIAADEFQETFTRAVKEKFYHGSVPVEELRKHSHVVLRQMIDDMLMDEEAKRRKLKADSEFVQQTIAQYERQYQNSPQWQQNRDKLLPGLQAAIERKSIRTRLEEAVKQVGQPSAADTEAYFRANRELFTEPERVRISAILLRVDPSSPQAVWVAALEEGVRIRAQLAKGASFSELARLHSADDSASRGGDMGYIHKGMLSEDATVAIDKLKIGEMTEAFRSLEGVLIIRLDERVPASVRKFTDVRQRAAELLARQRREKAWEDFRDSLYQSASVSLDKAKYPDFAEFALPAGKTVKR
jgi:parvulin-like peptidyl-prolyl isomerase